MPRKYDFTNKRIGKLVGIRVLRVEERPSQNHGNYWLCRCDCGNEVKVPVTYLTGNGNYTQTSCGCDRKPKAFKTTTNIGVSEEYLAKFTDDFNKYLFLHKSLIRTSGNTGEYYSSHIEEYKEIIDFFWSDKQFNAIYLFWKNISSQDGIDTYYDWAKPSLDHIVPRSKGGTNSLNNFQFLTTFENLAKRDMTQSEWQDFKKTTHTSSDYFIENILK